MELGDQARVRLQALAWERWKRGRVGGIKATQVLV